MITAEQARITAGKAIQTRLAKELNNIELSIWNATSMGKEITWLNGTISAEAKAKLESLGYTVKQTSDRTETCYSVSWLA